MKILIFDTETTGLPIKYNASIYNTSNWPFIIQLSYCIFDTKQNKIILNSNNIVKVDNIPEDSIKIHGITQEICNSKGRAISDVLNQFNTDARNADLLVAHNISFDKKIIIVECIREDIMSIFCNKPLEYCTMKNAINLCKIERKFKDGTSYFKYPTLTELHNYLFGQDPSGQHDAQNDILICLRCYYKMIYNKDIKNIFNAKCFTPLNI